MQPRYEEKIYESYFNTELDRRAAIYFPFGQVQEGSIGADAAALSTSRRLWRILGYPFWFRVPFGGVALRKVAEEMELLLGREIRNIPRLQVNLLFQYKRPEFITSPLGSEWPHWNQEYFRYTIYAEQQELLEHLHANFSGQALILYAAPALEDVNALVQAKLQGRMIECTNFQRAIDLAGHHRNTYVRAGTHSIRQHGERRKRRKRRKRGDDGEVRDRGAGSRSGKIPLGAAASIIACAVHSDRRRGSEVVLLHRHDWRFQGTHRSTVGNIT